MTDDVMIENSRQLVLAIDMLSDRHGLDSGDRVALSTMTLLEILVGKLGPLGTVERLRDLADAIERDLLARMS